MDHRAEKRRSFHRNTGDVKKKDRIASSMDHRAGKRRKLHRNTFLPYFVLQRPPTLGLIHLLQLHQVFFEKKKIKMELQIRRNPDVVPAF